MRALPLRASAALILCAFAAALLYAAHRLSRLQREPLPPAAPAPPRPAANDTEPIEIWSKAAIGASTQRTRRGPAGAAEALAARTDGAGDYLWFHVLGRTVAKQEGLWSLGTARFGRAAVRFRTGWGVQPHTVPQDARHVVLVLNGRTPEKIATARAWLDALDRLPRLAAAGIVLLGTEQCNNSWLHAYLPRLAFVFLVYRDVTLVDDQRVFQWPLGVATYRGFPLLHPDAVDTDSARPYLCNMVATVYANSSRVLLADVLAHSDLRQRCFVANRAEWRDRDTVEESAQFLRALRDSDYTLCPAGRNTEAYRIYEAAVSGSVPVVEDVDGPGCRDSLYLLRTEQRAPFLFLSNWTVLPDMLLAPANGEPQVLRARRTRVRVWYTRFLHRMRQRFLAVACRAFFGDPQHCGVRMPRPLHEAAIENSRRR